MNPDQSSDSDLLRRYAETGSREAYRQLVDRHAGMVYATASRILRNHHDAEDAAQTAFLLLAQKARSLGAGVVPAGWLHRTAWFAAKAVQAKAMSRKEHIGEEASDMPDERAGDAPDWNEVRVHIDEAIETLPAKSRAAVVLRYFEGRSLREVGDALACSEDAARKRIAWALDKIRPLLQRRGATLTGVTLATCLGASASAAEATPALVDPIVAMTDGAEASAAKLALAKDALAMMRRSTMKASLPYVVSAVVLAVAVAAGLRAAPEKADTPPPPAAHAPADATPEPERPNESVGKPGNWTIRGIVTDEEGNPLEGALIYAHNGQPYQSMIRTSGEDWLRFGDNPIPPMDTYGLGPTYSDANGVFRSVPLQPPIGGWVMAVHPDFGVSAAAITRNIVRDGAEVDVDRIALPAGHSLAGHVVCRGGKAVAGATVAIQPYVPGREGGLGRAAFGVGVYFRLGSVRIVKTDEEGNFNIGGMKEGRYRVAAWSDDCPPVEHEVNLGNASEAHDLAFQLIPGSKLTVRTVLLPDRRPLPGCTVRVAERKRWVRVNENGVCVFRGLTDRKHAVSVAPPDGAREGLWSPPPFHVSRSVEPGEVTIELYPWHTVTVRVVDDRTGSAIDSPRVEAMVVWKDFDRSYGQPDRINASGKEGVATLEGVRPGPWTFSVFADGYTPVSMQRVDVPMSGLPGPVTISMTSASSTLEGKLVREGTREPVAGARVTIRESFPETDPGARPHVVRGVNEVSVTSGADGAFELRGLWGARHEATVTIEGDGHVLHEVYMTQPSEYRKTPTARTRSRYAARKSLVDHIVIEKGSPRPSDLGEVSLSRACMISGIVRGPYGKGMAKYGVTLRYAEGGLKRHYSHWGATDDKGRFCIEGLAAGDYVLCCGHGGWRHEEKITLSQGDVRNLDLKSDGSPARDPLPREAF